MQLRNILKFHKWVSLIIGIQIFIWVLGGVVMSVIPIEKVRGVHKVTQRYEPAFDASNLMSLSEAVDQTGLAALKHAELATVLGRPVWRLTDQAGTIHIIESASGRIISPVSEGLALKIAKADYLGMGELSAVKWLENPPPEYSRPGPVWAIGFDDKDKTTIYISPKTADVQARRSATWRFYDFFWRLHVMDYDDGESFNHPLLILAAMLALIFVLSGFALLFTRARYIMRLKRARRNN